MQSSSSPVNSRWKGEERIVIGIDIGTTHTAVAYAYLYPGGPQVVKRVASWPGQAAQRYESKIPSIVWYDNQGMPKAFCAEARAPAIAARAEQEQWHLAEQFKLHVHPPSMATPHGITLVPLPPRVTAEQIYTDIFDYLFRHTQTFFEEKEFELEGGGKIWRKLALLDSIEFVIAHPSGWGLEEQFMLRRATVKAALVPTLQMAAHQVQFVGEAEASVHYVMFHADLQSRLQPGVDFVVCDAGGSTIDTTLYTVSSVTPSLALREKRDSACIQAGGIFVDRSASEYFRKKFYDGDLDPDQVTEYMESAMQKFITEVKPSFEDQSGHHLMAVADRHFSNPIVGIERGYMTLTGDEIEGFFKTWVDKIIESIQHQISNHPVKYILLVGGFGESPYLRRRLREAPGFRHIQFTIPDQSGAKAASEGSVLWTTKKSVVARATRFAFGVDANIKCDEQSAQQFGRRLIPRLDGSTGVNGAWDEIVAKGHVIEDGEEISCSYTRLYSSSDPDIKKRKDRIYMYDRNQSTAGDCPKWALSPSGDIMPGFEEVCTVDVDLSYLRSALQKKKDKNRSCWEKSKSYWVLQYRIAFTFGSTELKAFILWEDRGIAQRGPASIIPISRAV